MPAVRPALIMEGDLVGAARTCREIRDLNEAIGKRSVQTDSWRSSFELLLQYGQPAQAETLANEAVQESAKHKSLILQGISEELLARALLAQGKIGEAEDAITRGTVRAQNSKDRHTGLAVAITSAVIRAARGRTTNAETELMGVVNDANKAGFLDLRLEASMALVGLQLEHQEHERARVLLARVQADATAQGFNLIAAKARKAYLTTRR